jgi:TonB family protein
MLNDRTNREPVKPLVAGAVAALLLSVTIPIAGFSAFAQTRFATVFGTATDESGLPLASATVALSNTQTSAKYEVRANQRGAFELVGLPAGDYELGIRRPGFESSSETLSVGVGETLERNIVLRIGTVQETITVTNGPRRTAEPGSTENRVVTARPPARRPCPDPSVGGCIGPPLKVKDVRPIYPETLRDTSMAGTVLIEGQIGVDGRMKDMRVISAPHPAFEQSALEAVGQWEFTATTLNGREVDTRIRVSVSFAPEPPQ